MIEQFTSLIEQQDEPKMLSFLQSLSDKDKKALVPQVKKLSKHYSAFGLLGNGHYGYINGNEQHRTLIQMAAFVCCNMADYEKSNSPRWMLDKNNLEKIIQWYCPSWLSDFVNKQGTSDFIPYYLSYHWIMELTERGFLVPGKDLVVKLLPQTIFERNRENKWFLNIANLSHFKFTLQEHIWWLFEQESNLHHSGRYMQFSEDEAQGKIGWIHVFKQLAADNTINRMRLLKEALLASNRNFNKLLSGWFAELFTELDPGKEELLNLQKELFSVLSAPHSKPVNTALQAIKKLLTEKSFEATIFLDTVPVLLSSDTKAVITSTLMILEKLAAKLPAEAERIAILVSQCFIRSEEEVQTRAAKLIAKVANADNAVLRNQLSVYYPDMLSTARQVLIDFIDPEAGTTAQDPEEDNQVGQPLSLTSLEELPYPASIDDLVFLASQALDNNEPWHLDVFAAAVVQLRPKLTSADVPLFAPACQRAFALFKNGFRSTTGYLDHLLACFLIDLGNWLIRTFPDSKNALETLYHKYDGKEGDKITSFLVNPASGSYTSDWVPDNKMSVYEPYKQLLVAALENLDRTPNLPLLSTPTHVPCWLDPSIFITRLSLYQQEGVQPNSMDLQVAIARCFLHDNQSALDKASQLLTGEYKAIVEYLLNREARPQSGFQGQATWATAFLTKHDKKHWPEGEAFAYNNKSMKNYTGDLHWEAKVEKYKITEWSIQKGGYIETEDATRKIVEVHRDYVKSPQSNMKKIISKLFKPSAEPLPMLYEFMQYRIQFLSIEHNDIKRLLSLVPNNPESIVADTITKCLKHPEFWEEGDRRMVIAVQQFLHDTWQLPGKMNALFLAITLLSVDKTIISTAGSTWLNAVSSGTIDNVVLGTTIGKIEKIEFAPLKRFTDLVTQQLFRVSTHHNRALQVLVEHILVELPDEPIKHLKRLLEIYSELVAANKSAVHAQVVNKLKAWQGNPGLKKITDGLV